MRSKEIDEAINTIREFRKTGYCTLLLKCDNNRIRANTRIEISIETVLSYIETLEQLPNKIRDKIKELEEELELHQTYTIENDICSKLEILKSIIGE